MSAVKGGVSRRAVWAAGLALGAGVSAWPAWGQDQGRARKKKATASPYALAAGKSFWLPDVSPEGPVVALVNLHTQHVQVFRNGVAIGFSSASTGKAGYGTPVGLFTVLEKRRHHRSSTYNNAPMPWMVRLTWGGIAFHGGALPGYPASHGCIRLPMGFAPHLFGALQRGSAVAVVRQPLPEGQLPMTLLAPIDPEGKPLLTAEMLSQPVFWAAENPTPPAPEPAPVSSAQAALDAVVPPPAPAAATPAPPPLALLASVSQQRVFVLREGRVLAAASLPAQAAQAMQTALQGHNVFHWSGSGRWRALGTLDEAEATATASALPATDADTVLWRDVLPAAPDFAQRLRAALLPGSTLLLSHLPAVSAVHAAVWDLKHKT